MGNSPLKPLVLPGQTESNYTLDTLTSKGFAHSLVTSRRFLGKDVLVVSKDNNVAHNMQPDFIFLTSHGNQEDVETADAFFNSIRQCVACSFTVVSYEYSGYGLMCSRETSEEHIYDDAASAYAWIQTEFPDVPLFLFGRSLGSAPTLKLAYEGQKAIKGVIVQSPLVSAVATKLPYGFRGIFSSIDMFNTLDYTRHIRETPLMIIHGTDDAVVPATNGFELYDAHGGGIHTQLELIPGKKHNDIVLETDRVESGDTVLSVILKFIYRYKN